MQLNVTNKRGGGENSMKKALMIVLAILITVAFVTTVMAQDKKARQTNRPQRRTSP